LAFLHGKLKMTHTDLKPENILLESLSAPRPADFPREDAWREAQKPPKGRIPQYMRPATSHIRLIDFGNATYENEHHSSIINTRQYRGPEVILSLGWTELSDVWSMGCIFMELYTGELLFGTHENLEHLALMEQILEALPVGMLSSVSSKEREKYVKQHHSGQPRLNWPEGAESTSSSRHVRSQKRLRDMPATDKHASFAAFVGYCLTLDPKKRPSAAEALRHDFFYEKFND